MAERAQSPARTAYFGPAGTFTEEALLCDPDLADGDLVPVANLEEVLAMVASGGADLGFVPIENSIEGSVNVTVDSLVFEHDLLIQREVVLDVHLHLLAAPGTSLADVRRVYSYPVALAQCRGWLAQHLPGAETVAAKSTAGAAHDLGARPEAGAAAIAPALAAKLYGLAVLASSIEDHPDNQTRFVVLAREGIPAPTGHDRTTIVCFQGFDRPGSLLAILEQFAARSINLTRLESRPTKRALGQYCFIVDLEGHVDDEVVADCLRNLHVELARVKFLGSYPAAGESGPERRREAEEAWRAADAWVTSLRGRVRSGAGLVEG
ncbi:MAG: prephenate dehydratase [Acidimicrobiales bacterium]